LFTIVIFNDLIENNQRQSHEPPLIESATVDKEFKYLPGFFLPIEFPYIVHVTGSVNPEWVEDQIRVLRKVMDNEVGEAAITRACVDVARRASGYTSTISKELVVATLKKAGCFTTAYLSEGDPKEWLVPDVITPRGAITQGRIEVIFSGDQVCGTFRAQGLKR
jgi:hypothetical protein